MELNCTTMANKMLVDSAFMHVRMKGACSAAVQAEFYHYDSSSVFFPGRMYDDNIRI